MLELKEHELVVIERLLRDAWKTDVLKELRQNAAVTDFTSSPGGYYLTIKHPNLALKQTAYSKPTLIGEVDDITVGYVVFVEEGQLTLECHGWCGKDVPEDFRSRNVEVKEP